MYRHAGTDTRRETGRGPVVMRREVSIWPLTSDAEDALREVVAGKRTEALCFPVVPQTLRICGDGTDTDDCTGMVAEPMS